MKSQTIGQKRKEKEEEILFQSKVKKLNAEDPNRQPDASEPSQERPKRYSQRQIIIVIFRSYFFFSKQVPWSCILFSVFK